MTSAIDRIVNYLDPIKGLKRQMARQMLAATAYKAADASRLRSDWVLPGMHDDPDPDTWELSVLRARARDHNRNDPIAAGATDTLRTNIVGTGLKPQSRIRAERAGIGEELAAELQHQAEHAWALFSPTAGADNRLDMDELQFLAMTKIIEDGEAICLPTWADDAWRPLSRCIELVESERLMTPFGAGAGKNAIEQGIETGKRGEPLRYWIRKAGAKGEHLNEFAGIAARDSSGRPKVLHVYRTNRPGQLRGVPLFAPVLAYFKDMASYLEAEVVAARVAACLAVFVTKSDPMAAAYGMQASTESTTGARIQGIEPGMVGYLGMGESINVVDPKRPGDTFGPFVEQIMRIIGAAVGLPYELIAKDFSKTNYSSARASLLEGRRHFMNWRKWLARKVCQPVWELVLEEAYLRGRFDAKDFYRNRHEYCRAMWIGGGWGWVDPVKEVDASRKAVDYGLSNLAEECAAQGRDWEENLVQLAREQAAAKDLGVEITGSGSKPGPAPTKDDEGKDDAETK